MLSSYSNRYSPHTCLQSLRSGLATLSLTLPDIQPESSHLSIRKKMVFSNIDTELYDIMTEKLLKQSLIKPKVH